MVTKVKGSVDGSVLDNIEALLSASQSGQYTTLGYHTAGDGGGGEFYWDSSQDKANHNGGTIIDPDITFPTTWSNTTQQTTWFTAGTGTGCWVRVYEGPINVKFFGAKGDVATNDTLSITKSLGVGESVDVIGGETYLINPQTYTISSSDISITGGGTFKVSGVASLSAHLFRITGDNVVWDGPSVTGNGTFYDGSPPASEAARYSLIDVTGDNVKFLSGTITDPWMVGIHGDQCDNIYISTNMTFVGGPATQLSTYYQQIRLYTCTNFVVDNPLIKASATGKTEEGLLCSLGSNGRVQVRCLAAWDHGVYSISVDGMTVHGCYTITDHAGIAISPPEYQVNSDTISHVIDNDCIASPTVSGSVGLYLRDCHNSHISGNSVSGFARAYQIAPVQYDNVLNFIENVNFSDNIAKEWTEYGCLLSKSGLNLGGIKGVTIDCFKSTAASSGISTGTGEGAHISCVVGGIDSDIKVTNAVFRGGRYGCYLTGGGSDYSIEAADMQSISVSGIYATIDGIKIEGGKYKDAGTTAIDLVNSDNFTVSNIEITAPGAAMNYGIDGNNTSDQGKIINNTIMDATTVAVRRCQFANHKNTFYGNKTGTDALIGTIDLTAGTSTTLTNDNANFGFGYTSYLVLYPTESAAAAITPYVSAITDGTSFTLTHSSAAGGEIYYYEVKQ